MFFAPTSGSWAEFLRHVTKPGAIAGMDLTSIVTRRTTVLPGRGMYLADTGVEANTVHSRKTGLFDGDVSTGRENAD